MQIFHDKDPEDMASRVKIAAAKILDQKTHLIPGKLKVTEHHFSVPKDYQSPSSGTIKLFARSVRPHTTPADASDDSPSKPLPWMVYLQGGPGFGCSRPSSIPWLRTILDRGYQVLLLDQRGTGLSTPISPSTLGLRGSTTVQAKYLTLFRADNIVRDCEAVRLALTSSLPPDQRKWSTMGQSFGGFCTMSYLSFYPQGLRECFLYGGLQPLVTSPDPVYRATFHKVIDRNAAYYSKYPEDIARVKTIMRYLVRFNDGAIKTHDGGKLTTRRFRQLGIVLGMHGGVDALHDVVLRCASDIEDFGHITGPTLGVITGSQAWDNTLIYSILHEQIYCTGSAAAWSAGRIQNEFPAFDLEKSLDSDDKPVLFTGEMVYSWMFDDYSELAKVKDVAELVAKDDSWGPLFDEEQLARNEVPVYAAAYVEDMYVDFDLGRETARKIKGCKMFATNVMFHNAVSEKTKEVMEQLFALRDDVID